MAEQDESLEKLEHFVGLLAETRGKLQELGDQIDASVQELDKDEDDVEDKIGGFNDYVQEFTTTFENEHKEMVEALNKHDEVIADRGSAMLDARSGLITEAESEFEEAISSVRSTLDTDFGTLAEEGFEAFDTLLDNLATEINGIQGEAEEAFKGLGEAVDHFEEQADNALKETVETFEDVATSVTDAFTNKVESMFSEIQSHLTETVVGQFENDFSELTGNLESIFGNVGETVERVAGELVEGGAQILGDMASDIASDFMSAIEQGVTEAVEEVIGGLLEDIAESIAMMAVGSATTGVLAPYIPELAVAKAVVGAIKDFLDALNPFD
jgi:phage-related protein